MKTKTILAAPAKPGQAPFEISGYVVKLYVGNIQETFFIHPVPNDTRLTHYASGGKVGDLNQIKIRYMSGGCTLTDRAAAIVLLEILVAKHGADRVRTIMNSAEVINK